MFDLLTREDNWVSLNPITGSEFVNIFYPASRQCSECLRPHPRLRPAHSNWHILPPPSPRVITPGLSQSHAERFISLLSSYHSCADWRSNYQRYTPPCFLHWPGLILSLGLKIEPFHNPWSRPRLGVIPLCPRSRLHDKFSIVMNTGSKILSRLSSAHLMAAIQTLQSWPDTGCLPHYC